jgi:hypothetical protein
MGGINAAVRNAPRGGTDTRYGFARSDRHDDLSVGAIRRRAMVMIIENILEFLQLCIRRPP